jgi:hypothetical protein
MMVNVEATKATTLYTGLAGLERVRPSYAAVRENGIFPPYSRAQPHRIHLDVDITWL